MIERWVPQVSTYAADIDGIIWLIAVLVGFWFLVAEGVFFWLILKFRARQGEKAQYITGEEKKQMRFISWPHYLVLVCDVFIVVGAVRVWVEVKQELPSDAEAQHVRVISQQWAWSFVHPGADGKLDTADDIRTVDELHIQVGQKYIYELEARDVLHSFSVPVFRLNDGRPHRDRIARAARRVDREPIRHAARRRQPPLADPKDASWPSTRRLLTPTHTKGTTKRAGSRSTCGRRTTRSSASSTCSRACSWP
jgi:cytochrome c oxidase subunit 2